MTSVQIKILKASNPGMKLWKIIGDEDSERWGHKSRTLTYVHPISGETFDQLPAVYGYSWTPDWQPDNYRVDEEPLRQAYINLNNYDGDGYRRCVNYLFNDHSGLYNKQAFPKRELLTMSGNVVEEIEWLMDRGSRYLKFKALKPADNVSGMTWATHPHLVHRFTLVYWDAINEETKYTLETPRKKVYYYLTAPDGFGIIPARYVKAI